MQGGGSLICKNGCRLYLKSRLHTFPVINALIRVHGIRKGLPVGPEEEVSAGGRPVERVFCRQKRSQHIYILSAQTLESGGGGEGLKKWHLLSSGSDILVVRWLVPSKTNTNRTTRFTMMYTFFDRNFWMSVYRSPLKNGTGPSQPYNDVVAPSSLPCKERTPV